MFAGSPVLQSIRMVNELMFYVTFQSIQFMFSEKKVAFPFSLFGRVSNENSTNRKTLLQV